MIDIRHVHTTLGTAKRLVKVLSQEHQNNTAAKWLAEDLGQIESQIKVAVAFFDDDILQIAYDRLVLAMEYSMTIPCDLGDVVDDASPSYSKGKGKRIRLAPEKQEHVPHLKVHRKPPRRPFTYESRGAV
jgi:hypothetical protein